MNFIARPPGGRKVDPLVLRKALGAYGKVLHCTLRRDGQLNVELEATSGNQEVPKQILVDGVYVPLSAAPAATARGTIFDPDLAGTSCETVKAQLLDAVTEVRELPTRYNKLNTGRFLLTFPTKEVPSSVHFESGLSVTVRPHIPIPLRCRKCFEYGHHEDTCTARARCGNCSRPAHDGQCVGSPKCIGCGNRHAVTSVECERFRREMAINRLRVTQGVSKADAVAAVNRSYRQAQSAEPRPLPAATTIHPSVSYAQMTSSPVQQTAAQSTAVQPDPSAVIIQQQQEQIKQLQQLIVMQAEKTDRLVQSMDKQTQLLNTIVEQNNLLLRAVTAEPPRVTKTRSKRLKLDSDSNTPSPTTRGRIIDLLAKSTSREESSSTPDSTPLAPVTPVVASVNTPTGDPN